MQGTSKSLPSNARTSKPLPFNARNEIVNLFNDELGLPDIPRNTRVPKGAVHKIVRHYSFQATTQPFPCFLVEVNHDP